MTKEERLEEYKYMLSEFSKMHNFNNFGFCLYLNRRLTQENYPELYHYKPWWVIQRKNLNFINLNPFTLGHHHWFDFYNRKKRIQILEKIIKDMS